MSNTTPRDELREKINEVLKEFAGVIQITTKLDGIAELDGDVPDPTESMVDIVNAEVCQVLERLESQLVPEYDRNNGKYISWVPHSAITQELKRYGAKEEQDNGK